MCSRCLSNSKREEECLHPCVKVDQAGRPLSPKSLSIFLGLTLKLNSLCTIVNVVENIWTFWFVFNIFGLVAWKGLFWLGLAESDDLALNMAEMTRNIVGGHYSMFHVTWTTFKFNRNQLGTVSAYVM